MPKPYDSTCATVSVSIAVSVHASVSASVSVSVLVTVYCCFRQPGALPPPSAQLLQLPFCSINSGTRSLNNPLSPGAEKCHPEKAAQSSIAVVALPLSLHEPWRKRPVRNEARIYRLALDAMQSTRHFGQYWELCPGDQNGPAARRYFLSGSFAFLRGRLRNTTARKCIRHGFLLKGKPKGTYAA